MNSANWKFLLGGAVIIAALSWLGFVGYQESKSYYITVDEFAAMKSGLHGKTLKIAGDVVEGSIERSGPGLEFTITHSGKNLKVRYVGRDVLPDTFKGGSKAVVEGTLSDDGVLLARHIEAKCASKYEAEYNKKTT